MPGTPAHLFRRFFDVLTARDLTTVETEAVELWLPEPLVKVFLDQAPPDRRHGLATAMSVIEDGLGEPEVVVAALVHDIGKRHSRLGIIGRSVASVLIKAGLPMSRRMQIYRDHGILGAEDLARLRAPRLAIDFAGAHHGSRPASIRPDVWEALTKADSPPKALGMVRTWITSSRR